MKKIKQTLSGILVLMMMLSSLTIMPAVSAEEVATVILDEDCSDAPVGKMADDPATEGYDYTATFGEWQVIGKGSTAYDTVVAPVKSADSTGMTLQHSRLDETNAQMYAVRKLTQDPSAANLTEGVYEISFDVTPSTDSWLAVSLIDTNDPALLSAWDTTHTRNMILNLVNKNSTFNAADNYHVTFTDDTMPEGVGYVYQGQAHQNIWQKAECWKMGVVDETKPLAVKAVVNMGTGKMSTYIYQDGELVTSNSNVTLSDNIKTNGLGYIVFGNAHGDTKISKLKVTKLEGYESRFFGVAEGFENNELFLNNTIKPPATHRGWSAIPKIPVSDTVTEATTTTIDTTTFDSNVMKIDDPNQMNGARLSLGTLNGETLKGSYKISSRMFVESGEVFMEVAHSSYSNRLVQVRLDSVDKVTRHYDSGPDGGSACLSQNKGTAVGTIDPTQWCDIELIIDVPGGKYGYTVSQNGVEVASASDQTLNDWIKQYGFDFVQFRGLNTSSAADDWAIHYPIYYIDDIKVEEYGNESSEPDPGEDPDIDLSEYILYENCADAPAGNKADDPDTTDYDYTAAFGEWQVIGNMNPAYDVANPPVKSADSTGMTLQHCRVDETNTQMYAVRKLTQDPSAPNLTTGIYEISFDITPSEDSWLAVGIIDTNDKDNLSHWEISYERNMILNLINNNSTFKENSAATSWKTIYTDNTQPEGVGTIIQSEAHTNIWNTSADLKVCDVAETTPINVKAYVNMTEGTMSTYFYQNDTLVGTKKDVALSTNITTNGLGYIYFGNAHGLTKISNLYVKESDTDAPSEGGTVVPPVAGEEFQNLNETFDSWTTVPDNSSWDSPGGSYAFPVLDTVEGTNQALYINPNSENYERGIRYKFNTAVTEGTLNISYDLKVKKATDSAGGQQHILWPSLDAAADGSDWGSAYPYLNNYKVRINYNLDEDRGVTNDLVPEDISEDTWYTVEMSVRPAYSKYDIKITEKSSGEIFCEYTDKAFENRLGEAQTKVEAFTFRTWAGDSWIDNMKIEHIKQKPVLSNSSIKMYDALGNQTSSITTNVTPALGKIELDFATAMADVSGITLAGKDAPSINATINEDDPSKVTLTLGGLLAGGETYTLTVPGTVAAVNGETMGGSGFVLEFATGSVETIADMTGVTVDGAAVTTFAELSEKAGSTAVINTSAVNASDELMELTYVVVYYNGNKCLSVESIDVPDVASNDMLKTMPEFTIEIPTGATKAKIFLWSTLNNMIPYCEALEF